MATTNKQKYPRLTSPKLALIWPRLFTPDTKFDEDGVYSTRGRRAAGDAETLAFVKRLDEEVQKSLRKAQEENPKVAAKIVTVAPYNDDHEEYPGDIVFNFKLKAKVKPKDKTKPPFAQKPAVFDAKAIPMDPATRVGNGSIGKVTFDMVPYYSPKDKEAGVSLRLVAAQITDLKEFDGSLSASAYGFEVEDNGVNDEETPVTVGATDSTEEVDF